MLTYFTKLTPAACQGSPNFPHHDACILMDDHPWVLYPWVVLPFPASSLTLGGVCLQTYLSHFGGALWHSNFTGNIHINWVTFNNTKTAKQHNNWLMDANTHWDAGFTILFIQSNDMKLLWTLARSGDSPWTGSTPSPVGTLDPWHRDLQQGGIQDGNSLCWLIKNTFFASWIRDFLTFEMRDIPLRDYSVLKFWW